MDQLLLITVINLGAEVIDVNVNDIGQALKTQVPDMLDDHGTSNSAAGIAHQVFQHRIFALRKIDRLAAACDHVPHAIKLQVFHAELVQQLLGPPQKSVDPGQQLFKRKWLYQIIVGARLQSANTSGNVFACTQK